MTETMRRWSIDAFGAGNLAQATTPIPTPGPGELLVRVRAVSLNYRDKLMLETGMGMPIALPFVPTSDMAGIVEAAGPGATRFAAGDRVIAQFSPHWIEGVPAGTASAPPYGTLGGFEPGVLSEFVCFPQDWFVAAPAGLDDAEASTLPVAGLTAWTALIERGRLKAGETVLVQGTGGVALFGLQIAKAHGARVIVTSGSAEKLARAAALGADIGIDRTAGDWAKAVQDATGDHGADHILELVGGANLGRSLQAVAVHGRISVIGVLEGFDLSALAGPLILKSVTVQGIMVGPRRGLEDLVRAVDATGIRPVIDRRYPFDAAPEAFAHLDRGPFGKVVVELR